MNSLDDRRVAACIERLHQAAAGDAARREARSPKQRADESLTRMGNLYLAVSPDEGRMLYLLARGAKARTLIEFGASFGVSTIYLAAAARDNDGRLVTTEVHPAKCAATRAALAEARLADVTDVLEGDARQTLIDIDAPIDFVFLDGWKSLYLPVLELLLPKLTAGALIVADNIAYDGCLPYAEFVRTDSAFVSQTLGKIELTCWTGAS